MHPHVNDEILSYFRIGKVMHRDSAGITETISQNKMMLMKAGKVFQHEEKIVDCLEGLQIFIRPQTADYAPEVAFADFDETDSLNAWRLIASYEAGAHLQFTSETAVFDMTINEAGPYTLPVTQIEHALYLLYTFHGSILVNGKFNLTKGECVVSDEANVSFTSEKGAEVALFVTNQEQECFAQGMFSGNKA